MNWVMAKGEEKAEAIDKQAERSAEGRDALQRSEKQSPLIMWNNKQSLRFLVLDKDETSKPCKDDTKRRWSCVEWKIEALIPVTRCERNMSFKIA